MSNGDEPTQVGGMPPAAPEEPRANRKRWLIGLGVVGLGLIVAAGVAVAVSGGNGSVNSGGGQPASSVPVGGSGAAGASGQANGGSGGGATSGTTGSSTNGTTTSTNATTPTTIHNTIKPIPGRPAPPTFDNNHSSAYSASPEANGLGVCRGPNHYTTMSISWETFNTDYVQLGGDRGTNYPPDEADHYISVQCDADHGPNTSPSATIFLTAFGPGGEVSQPFSIFVDSTYQP